MKLFWLTLINFVVLNTKADWARTMRDVDNFLQRHRWQLFCAVNCLPIITRKYHNEVIGALRKQLQEEAGRSQCREITALRTEYDKFMRYVHSHSYSYDLSNGRAYRLTIAFDPQAMGHFSRDARDMELLGDHVSWMVKREIATSRFIGMANDEECRRFEREARCFPPNASQRIL